MDSFNPDELRAANDVIAVRNQIDALEIERDNLFERLIFRCGTVERAEECLHSIEKPLQRSRTPQEIEEDNELWRKSKGKGG